MKKYLLALPVAIAAAATPALATAPDYSTLSSAVDFSGVTTALLAVGATIIGVLIVRKGIKFVLASLR